MTKKKTILNAAQQQAVNKKDGALMLIAGPGTGKTQTLVQSVIAKMQDGEGVLCLTFTEAGSVAMRQRIKKMHGNVPKNVLIGTFHGFCREIINENSHLFGRAELVTEIEQIEIVRSMISNLGTTHPLRPLRGSIFSNEKRILSLFQQMKMQCWDEAMFVETIAKHIEMLPSKEGFHYKRKYKGNAAGSPKTALIEAEIEKMSRLMSAVKLFALYESRLKNANLYEFADMLQWVVDAFEQDSVLLKSTQEKYPYLLVDEFQDTNGIQNKIIALLTQGVENPNILVVGDDDQAIYEFQGARIAGIKEFVEKYEPETILLCDNYRSTDSIVAAGQRLLKQNTIRLIADKQINAANTSLQKFDALPTVAQYTTATAEAADIVQQIQALISDGTPPSEIAVIYAKHAQGVHILHLLKNAGVPAKTKKPLDALTESINTDIFGLMRFLIKELETPSENEGDLIQVLNAPFWGINQHLPKIALGIQEEKRNGSRKTWWSAINDTEFLKTIELEGEIENIKRVGDALNILLSEAQNLPLGAFFMSLLHRTGALKYATESTDALLTVQTLRTVQQFIENENRKGALKLRAFMAKVDAMLDNRIALPIVLNRKTDAVELMTAHGSKGLEFDAVFIIDAQAKFWEKKRGSSEMFSLPEPLTKAGPEDETEAARRLFYVAMTRAKTKLHISYHTESQDGRTAEPSMFLDEIGITPTPKTVSDDVLLSAQIELLTASPSANVNAAKIAEVLKRLPMTASRLNLYLKCRTSFFYQEVLDLPFKPSESTAYGTAVHEAVRWLAKATPENRTEQAFINAFQKAFEKNKFWLSPNGMERRMELAKQNLPIYFKNRIGDFSDTIATEKEVKSVMDGIALKGVIDRIAMLDDKPILIDYKTGTVVKADVEPPSKNNPNGGDYWRQIVFYSIVTEIENGRIDCIDPDAKKANKAHNIRVRDEDKSTVRAQIKAAHAAIQKQQFNGCQDPDCAWCAFAKKGIL